MARARYRKIDLRIHADKKFRSLSAPPPNGQTLWMYLLTSPQGMSIPGLLSVGESGIAEALGWSLKGFRDAFAEVSSKGMCEADWNARVIWVPNALRYNPPESPNVVKSWRPYWEEVPESELKKKSLVALEQSVKSIGDGFVDAFNESFGDALKEALSEGLREALREPCLNQEQEQEQKQEQKGKRSCPRWDRALGESLPGLVLFWNTLPKKARDRSSQKQCWEEWRRLGCEENATSIIAALEKWKLCRDWIKDDGQFIPGAHRWLKNEKWKNVPADTSAPQPKVRDLSTVNEVWESTEEEIDAMESMAPEAKP